MILKKVRKFAGEKQGEIQKMLGFKRILVIFTILQISINVYSSINSHVQQLVSDPLLQDFLSEHKLKESDINIDGPYGSDWALSKSFRFKGYSMYTQQYKILSHSMVGKFSKILFYDLNQTLSGKSDSVLIAEYQFHMNGSIHKQIYYQDDGKIKIILRSNSEDQVFGPYEEMYLKDSYEENYKTLYRIKWKNESSFYFDPAASNCSKENWIKTENLVDDIIFYNDGYKNEVLPAEFTVKNGSINISQECNKYYYQIKLDNLGWPSKIISYDCNKLFYRIKSFANGNLNQDYYVMNLEKGSALNPYYEYYENGQLKIYKGNINNDSLVRVEYQPNGWVKSEVFIRSNFEYYNKLYTQNKLISEGLINSSGNKIGKWKTYNLKGLNNWKYRYDYYQDSNSDQPSKVVYEPLFIEEDDSAGFYLDKAFDLVDQINYSLELHLENSKSKIAHVSVAAKMNHYFLKSIQFSKNDSLSNYELIMNIYKNIKPFYPKIQQEYEKIQEWKFKRFGVLSSDGRTTINHDYVNYLVDKNKIDKAIRYCKSDKSRWSYLYLSYLYRLKDTTFLSCENFNNFHKLFNVMTEEYLLEELKEIDDITNNYCDCGMEIDLIL